MTDTTERRYQPAEIEARWQEIWDREQTWHVENLPPAAIHQQKSYVPGDAPVPER